MTPQAQLDILDALNPFGFLDVSNFNNHRILLLLALDLTEDRPVVEYGSGFGSTPYLQKYCEEVGQDFYSYDSDKEWAKKTGSKYVADWDKLKLKDCGVCFIDLAPGEYRQTMVMRMKDMADIICVHDTEIGGAGNYGFDFSQFKYQLHYNRHGGGAGASLVSNKVDVSQFAGMKLGDFTFDK